MGPLLLTVCALTLSATPAVGAPVPTIAVDPSSLDRPTFERLEGAGMFQALVLRLVGENVALVDPRAHADYALRLQTDARTGGLRLAVQGPGGERSRTLDIRALDQDEVKLHVVHAAIELVRQVMALPSPRPPGSPPPPGPLSPRADLAAGGLWNAGKPGLLLRLGGMYRLGPVDLGASVVFHRPFPEPTHLDLTEWGAFAAIGTGEHAPAPWLRLSATLDLGVLRQSFRYSGADGSDSGSRLDPAGALHGAATWRLSPSWRVGVATGALLSRGRSHHDSSDRLFRTPALRPFAGLTLAFGQETER